MELTRITESGNSIEVWARRIYNHYRGGIQHIILAGHDLESAVVDFQQQDGKHWKHAYGELLRQVGMSNQMAGQLRDIAKNPALSNPRNHHALPPAWTTLREIAKLPPPEVDRRIRAGDISPQTKGTDVKAWKESNPNKCVGSSHKKPPETLDEAHDIFIKLPGAEFIIEVVNLVNDHPTVTASEIINALQEIA